jgi:hypothetical protein
MSFLSFLKSAPKTFLKIIFYIFCLWFLIKLEDHKTTVTEFINNIFILRIGTYISFLYYSFMLIKYFSLGNYTIYPFITAGMSKFIFVYNFLILVLFSIHMWNFISKEYSQNVYLNFCVRDACVKISNIKDYLLFVLFSKSTFVPVVYKKIVEFMYIFLEFAFY